MRRRQYPARNRRCRRSRRWCALRAAGRKYNVPVDDLNALAARYAADLSRIDESAQALAALEAAARQAQARYDAAAGALSAARRKSAQKLDRAVNAELKPL